MTKQTVGLVEDRVLPQHNIKRLSALLLIVACSAPSFAANWPPSIVGTWEGFANQSAVKLVITSQGTAGACKSITGNLSNLPSGGASNIQGFYCPETGRISFARKDSNNNTTFQFYIGNLSDIGPELRMAGTFAEINMTGHLGEYNFSLGKREKE